MAPTQTLAPTATRGPRRRKTSPHAPTYRELIDRRSNPLTTGGNAEASRQFARGTHGAPPRAMRPEESAAGRARHRARISTRRHG